MPKNFEKKIACEVCTVAKYCGTMVSSIRLCRSIHKQLEMEEKALKEDEEYFQDQLNKYLDLKANY